MDQARCNNCNSSMRMDTLEVILKRETTKTAFVVATWSCVRCDAVYIEDRINELISAHARELLKTTRTLEVIRLGGGGPQKL
jgi:uncharacterized protein with PIN domain